MIKILRRKLFDNILSHVEMDDGIRHSLASGFGFVGFVLATFLAIAVMGGDLSNVALVAGALSVGIGLGLQNIVNNFVSGIILLFERPVKVGDWVIINGEEGRIKQINIRSTEVETFKKSSVIIPNATLLSTSVTNLTHSNNWSRQSVTVGVAYGTDPHKVTDILLECAKSNKKVMKNPAPYVILRILVPAALISSCVAIPTIFGTVGQYQAICAMRLTAASVRKELKFRLISWWFTAAAKSAKRRKRSSMRENRRKSDNGDSTG